MRGYVLYIDIFKLPIKISAKSLESRPLLRSLPKIPSFCTVSGRPTASAVLKSTCTEAKALANGPGADFEPYNIYIYATLFYELLSEHINAIVADRIT